MNGALQKDLTSPAGGGFEPDNLLPMPPVRTKLSQMEVAQP